MSNLPVMKDLHIRITSKCNFNCPHCYAADWFKDNVSLDFDTICSTIKQATQLGCKKATFTGGEPLISECIAESIKFCFENDLRVEVETNGVLIDSLIEKLGSEISKIEFAVSYDGEDMRNKECAELVRNNIEKLANLGCDLKLQTVITEINEKEIDHMFGFSERIKARNRVFLAHSPTGNGRTLPLFEISKWMRIVKELKAKYSHIIIELPDIFSGGGQKKCGWGVHRCEIMPNGDVTSCAPITFTERKYIAGNVKTEPLEKIWESEHFTYIRNLSQKDFTSLCAKCVYWKTCLGACRSISSSTGDGLLCPHPFCTALFNAVKTNSIDPDLIAGIKDIVDNWIAEIENENFQQEETKYETIVRAQHKLL